MLLELFNVSSACVHADVKTNIVNGLKHSVLFI